MTNIIKPIIFAIMASTLASTAFAQSDETETAPAEETTTAEVAPDLSLGEPVGPQVGQEYIAETIGDWAIRCLKVEEGEDPCQLFQPLFDSNQNRVAEISMNTLPGNGQVRAGANLIAPLGTALGQQITITVDGGQGRRYPFAFCAQIGCVARIGLTAQDIASYKAGAGATVALASFDAPDQLILLPLSLTGFTAAYDSLAN